MCHHRSKAHLNAHPEKRVPCGIPGYRTHNVGGNTRTLAPQKHSLYTYDFSSCFFRKLKKSAKRGFSREMTHFVFVSTAPTKGEGVPLTRFLPQKYETL